MKPEGWRYATSLFWHIRWGTTVRAVGVVLAGMAYGTGHNRIGDVLIGLLLAYFLYFIVWPGICARRCHLLATWWTPAPGSWLGRQLPTPLPLGPIVWEVHAQDARRWRAPTPHDAARAYRQTYADEVIRLIQTRPDTVALMSSGFNRLTPDEEQAIWDAGGRVWDGPLWPRLLRRYPPWIMALTQRRMFGSVVSRKDRRHPATWVTWVVPARQQYATGGVHL